MKLCENCLETTEARPTPVGPEKGPQRDPYQETLQLCSTCFDCLMAHDLAGFAGRFSKQRMVIRADG